MSGFLSNAQRRGAGRASPTESGPAEREPGALRAVARGVPRGLPFGRFEISELTLPMRIRTFTVPIHDDGDWTGELNRFLGSCRVLDIEREFVQDGARSRWCFCVSYLEGNAGREVAAKGRRIDYREVLDDSAFATFAELRRRRKAISEAEGIPAFAVFTDAPLAGMAGLDEFTAATMARAEGGGLAVLTGLVWRGE